jgi:hypothetical protein
MIAKVESDKGANVANEREMHKLVYVKKEINVELIELMVINYTKSLLNAKRDEGVFCLTRQDKCELRWSMTGHVQIDTDRTEDKCELKKMRREGDDKVVQVRRAKGKLKAKWSRVSEIG